MRGMCFEASNNLFNLFGNDIIYELEREKDHIISRESIELWLRIHGIDLSSRTKKKSRISGYVYLVEGLTEEK